MHSLNKHSKRAQRVITGSLQTSRCFAQFDSPLDAWTNISLGRATLSVDLLKLELLLMGDGGAGRPAGHRGIGGLCGWRLRREV